MSARISKQDIATYLRIVNARLAEMGFIDRLRVDYAYGGAMLQSETGRDLAARTTRSGVYDQLRAIDSTLSLG